MHTKATAILVAAVTIGAAAATASAQSAPTCSFDPATATVTVTVDVWDARVRADAATGEIQLNGVACGAATVTNTDSILLNGGLLNDVVSLAGSFTPGLTPESDGASEIEIVAALRIQAWAGQDILVGDAGSDRLHGGAGPDSIDGGGGADELHGGDASDIITGGAGHDEIFGEDGNDTIYNAGDEMSDKVDCGLGTDDADEDPLDTLTACEL